MPVVSWGLLRSASIENGCCGKNAEWTPGDASDTGEENADLLPPVTKIVVAVYRIKKIIKYKKIVLIFDINNPVMHWNTKMSNRLKFRHFLTDAILHLILIWLTGNKLNFN